MKKETLRESKSETGNCTFNGIGEWQKKEEKAMIEAKPKN